MSVDTDFLRELDMPARAAQHPGIMNFPLKAGVLFLGTTFLFVASAQVPVNKNKEVRRPPIVGVSHIALNTDNMDAARKFYTGMLGFEEAFSMNKPDGSLMLTNFKVNDHQFIQVFPDLRTATQDRLNHICFETTDAEQLRAYMASKGVAGLPDKLEPMKNGSLAFEVHDPDGHLVEFVEYRPGSLYSNDFGKHLGARRISERIIHVGVTVKDRAAADHFYKDILGFKLQWHGGMKDTDTDWVAMRVPDGTDWLEYMLNVNNPNPHTLGVMHHLSLGVPDIQAGYKLAVERGYKSSETPKGGRDGKYQYNLYEPNFPPAELMEPKPGPKPLFPPL